MIKALFGGSADLVVREILDPGDRKLRAALIHIDGLVRQDLVSEVVLARIADRCERWHDPKDVARALTSGMLPVTEVRETTSVEQVVTGLCDGGCAILVEGKGLAVLCHVPGWPERAVEEPVTEPTVRGPKEGFTEGLRTNTSLLRKRIRSQELRIEEIRIGRITRTTIALVYVASLVNQEVLQEVRRRLSRIDVDSIQESGHLEELIEDNRLSPFPTILRTERVDKAVGNLLEGRVAIITDGTPFVLIVPATFTMFLSTPEDYFERFFIGSFLRMIRFVAFVLSFTLSSLYVAITTFHQEMLPTRLLWSIAAQREGIPFPAMVETLIMEFTFEILREAGLRLPRVVGQTVSVIGVLVVGDAAIRAGLASAAMVVVLASSAIASFAAPTFSIGISARILRFAMIVLGGSMGLFGVVVGFFLIFLHLAALRSFGVPYLAPLSPLVLPDMKDMLIRLPWWAMRRRPTFVAGGNVRRAPATPQRGVVRDRGGVC